MAKNHGRSLEDITALIEERLAPAGFKVETRRRVHDNKGEQIAEFDIVITGEIGTAPVSCLIECRDRPSEGPAPGAWIEQLVGRRNRFNFAKVMAVSSTGFSTGARDEAEWAGIELRTLVDLTYEAVADWLPANAPIIIQHAHLDAVRVFLHADSAAPQQPTQWRFDIDQKALEDQESGKVFTIAELWQRVRSKNAVWRGVKVGGAALSTTINALDHLSATYVISSEEHSLLVEAIEFDVTLQIEVPKMPLVHAAKYTSQSADDPENTKTFAIIGRWQGTENDVIKHLTVISIPKQSGEENPT